MPITLSCACSRTLLLADTFAGKLVSCPGCSAILRVPVPIQEADIIDTPAMASAVAQRSVPMPILEIIDECIVAAPSPMPSASQPSASQPSASHPAPSPEPVELDEPPPRSRADDPRRTERRRRARKLGPFFTKTLGVADGWWCHANGSLIGGGSTMLFGIIVLLVLVPMGGGSVFGILLISVGAIATLKGLMDLY
ncbi:MAG: hypothetical protein L0Y71_10900 [Gemmataceae bacterium]|nr:hypothetical protein [Gemmataceae bacterium]